MTILGIDEVGRGPWAGPLVVGAVALENSQDEIWAVLDDSKKLTQKKREQLSPLIIKNAKLSGLGYVESNELDEIGLASALKLATMRAIINAMKDGNNSVSQGVTSAPSIKTVADFNRLVSKLQKPTPKFTEIIIDGTINFLKGTVLENLVTVLPKADSKIKEVSAASIIAKVSRDNYMKTLSKKYPEYGFDKHVGYGTATHKKSLVEFGPCPEHRFSFRPVAEIAGLENKKQMPESPTTKKGSHAESIIADFLQSSGHKILARNYKTRFYEIDIISATPEHIYFTEVKYRKSSNNGTPLEYIDYKKKRKISFAADSFMNYLSKKLGRELDNLPSPILAAGSVSGPEFTFDSWTVLTD